MFAFPGKKGNCEFHFLRLHVALRGLHVALRGLHVALRGLHVALRGLQVAHSFIAFF